MASPPRSTNPGLFQPGDGASDYVLNWTDLPDAAGELGVYAHAYHHSARDLWEGKSQRMANGNGADFEMLAPIFLLRHAIELGLKASILRSRGILRTNGVAVPADDRVLTTHNLDQLWRWMWDAAREFLDSETLRALGLHEAGLLALHHMDGGSFSFRYPVRKDGQLSLPKHFRFDGVATMEHLFALTAAIDDLAMELEDRETHVLEEYEMMHGGPFPGVLHPVLTAAP